MDKRDTYENGIKKWDVAKFPHSHSSQPTNFPHISNTIFAKIGCNIKTDIVNKTFKIEDPTDSFSIIAFFINNQVASWDIQGNNIQINSSDGVSYLVGFESVEEMLIGDKRIYKIIEGENIIACGDENL